MFFEQYVSRTIWIKKAFTEFGKIGFTSFLEARIPWTLLLELSDFEYPYWISIIGCGLKLMFAIAFGYIITKYIENPPLKWGRNIERKLL